MKHRGTYRCPCGQRIPITYKSRRWPRPRIALDRLSLADVWAHLWSHEEPA